MDQPKPGFSISRIKHNSSTHTFCVNNCVVGVGVRFTNGYDSDVIDIIYENTPPDFVQDTYYKNLSTPKFKERFCNSIIKYSQCPLLKINIIEQAKNGNKLYEIELVFSNPEKILCINAEISNNDSSVFVKYTKLYYYKLFIESEDTKNAFENLKAMVAEKYTLHH